MCVDRDTSHLNEDQLLLLNVLAILLIKDDPGRFLRRLGILHSLDKFQSFLGDAIGVIATTIVRRLFQCMQCLPGLETFER
mmetsp:Transcript_14169/g.23621  ORF Transcript_14169/g.23621 Transcript_14169/m.23621 type:complete len:81 (-) Transcript_14169:611-853(-)